MKDSASPAARRVEASPSKPSKVTTTATNGAGKVVQAEVLSSERAWSREACQDWIDRFDGTAPGGQIGKALKKMGPKPGRTEFVACVFGMSGDVLPDDFGMQRDDSLCDASDAKASNLGIPPEFGIPPGDLALEMVASVDLLKQ